MNDIDDTVTTEKKGDVDALPNKSQRIDRNGNPITTIIGNFAIANQVNRNKSIKNKRNSGMSPGTGEVSSPEK